MMWIRPGRRVTVSLSDGSALSGRTRPSWPWNLRLSDVSVAAGEVPGTVVVPCRNVLTVQVRGR